MEFKEVIAAVVRRGDEYAKEYQVSIDKTWALLKLTEEVGEFMQSVLVHERKSRPSKFLPPEQSKEEVGKELADVVGMAIICASHYDIDLEDALKKKWIDRKPTTNN